jgi:predicted dehydrogenase
MAKQPASIRIAILGAGSFGLTRARAMMHLTDADVTLGWSRSAASRQRFARDLGRSTTEHWEELCTSDEADAVLVCTPHVEHYRHAKAALMAGKHVLVETPLCLHYAEARELADLAGAEGIQEAHLAEALQYRRRQGE